MSSQKSRKAKSLRATRGGSQLRKTKNVPGRNVGLVMHKSPRVIMPPEFDTTLKYLTYETMTNIGGAAASVQYRTEAYDVDPALASTAMPGFAEFAGFYQRFRTLGMSYKFSVCNAEAFPVIVLHGFTVNAIASGSLSLRYAGNPLFSTHTLGPATGQGRAIFQKSASVVQIVGTAQPLYDDLYTGSTTSATLATAGTVYCHLGAITGTPFTAAGIVVYVEVSLHIRFYRPNALLS